MPGKNFSTQTSPLPRNRSRSSIICSCLLAFTNSLKMEFNDVRLQYDQLSDEIDSAIAQVFSSGKYILGPAGRAFEEEFARYCRSSSGVGVASGTDALKIGLAAVGVAP